MNEEEYLKVIEDKRILVQQKTTFDQPEINEIIGLYLDALKPENLNFAILNEMAKLYGAITTQHSLLFAIHPHVKDSLLLMVNYNNQHCGNSVSYSANDAEKFNNRKMLSCSASSKFVEGNLVRIKNNSVQKKTLYLDGFYTNPPNVVLQVEHINSAYTIYSKDVLVYLGSVETIQNSTGNSKINHKYTVSKWLVTEKNKIVYSVFDNNTVSKLEKIPT